jgi:hypothetical membrane protein
MDSERYAIYCGILAPILSLGCVGLSTVIAPPGEFTWQSFALSDLGRPDARTYLLFNAGLIGGGLVGLPLVWPLWRRARNRVEQVGTGMLLISLVGLALIGVFHLPHPLHGLVAILFFVGGPFTHWVYGTGQALAGDVVLGLVSVWFGILHVIGWTGWLLYLSIVQPGEQFWFAVPEMVAALAFGGWAVTVARSLLD